MIRLPFALSSGWEDATVTDVVALVGVEVITAVVFFFAGAMAGSFLNVVLYRLPRRRNLLWPPSCCPACGRRLRLADNVPVLSWLMLRGRCRRCKAAIAPGYLWVEVGCGVAALALLYLIVHTGGATLPLRSPEQYGGALWTIWYPRPEILWIYASYCALAFFLVCLSLFAASGLRLPAAVVLTGVAFAVLPPLLGYHVQQVPLAGAAKGAPLRAEDLGGAAESLAGLSAGAALGAALALVSAPRKIADDGPRPLLPLPARLDLAVALSLAGAWLGWQAAVSVAVLTALALALGPRRWPAVVVVTGAVAAQLACWRVLAHYVGWWPGPHTPPAFMAGGAALATALAGVGRRRAWAADWSRRATAGTPPEPPPEPPPAPPAAPAG